MLQTYNILSFIIMWTKIKKIRTHDDIYGDDGQMSDDINGIAFDDSNNDDDAAVEERRNGDEIEQVQVQEGCYSSESEGDQNTNFEYEEFENQIGNDDLHIISFLINNLLPFGPERHGIIQCGKELKRCNDIPRFLYAQLELESPKP
ncbi:hypothetical protein INT45_007357 [Circinella minor]|uniref:Uncharacterized protein n=1 Tax=Circinella minor TaxID=1195481 RepID=A0A8H7VHJ0_9FUNG|nr:hypothetical protein INT45_007357 [Circinella minor]